jgi:predicted RNA-binding protein with PUA domain
MDKRVMRYGVRLKDGCLEQLIQEFRDGVWVDAKLVEVSEKTAVSGKPVVKSGVWKKRTT